MTPAEYALLGVSLPAIAVSGDCVPSPYGELRYRGVDIATGKELFRHGPIAGGTADLAALFAIAHAIATDKQGSAIYCDNAQAVEWANDPGQIRAEIPTPNISALLRRTRAVLSESTAKPVLWRRMWGTIPAHFCMCKDLEGKRYARLLAQREHYLSKNLKTDI